MAVVSSLLISPSETLLYLLTHFILYLAPLLTSFMTPIKCPQVSFLLTYFALLIFLPPPV